MAVHSDTLMKINRAEAAVLAFVNQQEEPISPRIVTEAVQKQGVDKSSIVSAIWFLIDRDAIHLTLDLKLAPHPHH